MFEFLDWLVDEKKLSHELLLTSERRPDRVAFYWEKDGREVTKDEMTTLRKEWEDGNRQQEAS